MKAVLYTGDKEFDYYPDAKEVPTPGPNEVLIKVECAPINPSDIYYMRGKYSGSYNFPLVTGGEGSGTVIGYGGGWLAWSLMGKRVSFCKMAEKPGKFTANGSFAEFTVTSAYNCLTLDQNTSFE